MLLPYATFWRMWGAARAIGLERLGVGLVTITRLP